MWQLIHKRGAKIDKQLYSFLKPQVQIQTIVFYISPIKLVTNKNTGDTNTVADSNISLSTTDETIRQKISKDIGKLNTATNHENLINTYTTFQPTVIECTFFQAAMEHTQRETIIQIIKRFSRFKVIKSYTVCSLTTVESITKKKKKEKETSKHWKLHNTLLNNLWVQKEVSKKCLNTLNWIKMRYQYFYDRELKQYWEIYGTKCLH